MTAFWLFFAGTVFVFRVYGIVVAVFFILFVLVNFYNRNEGGITKDLPDDVDPKTVSYSIRVKALTVIKMS